MNEMQGETHSMEAKEWLPPAPPSKKTVWGRGFFGYRISNELFDALRSSRKYQEEDGPAAMKARWPFFFSCCVIFPLINHGDRIKAMDASLNPKKVFGKGV